MHIYAQTAVRAGHAEDISIVFCNYEMNDLQGSSPGLADASKAMSSYFSSFARSAIPTAAGRQLAWPPYDASTRQVMLLNAKCEAANDPDGTERKFWQSLAMGEPRIRV